MFRLVTGALARWHSVGNTTAAPAVRTVFNTPELLEMIILQCDLRTLLTRALRVSHQWHDAIESSPAIQEALFFRPAPKKEGTEPTLNPILVEEFGLFFDGKRHTLASFDALPIAGYGENCRREAFMRTRASWRDMLVRQPPVKRRGFWSFESGRGDGPADGLFWESDAETNLTMGKLYDDGVRICRSRVSHFIFYWNPQSQRSFASLGGLDDPRVWIDDDEKGIESEVELDDEGWEHPKHRLSEFARNVDLLEGVRVPTTCIMGPLPVSKVKVDFEKRFTYSGLP